MARSRLFIVLALALTAGGALAFATYNFVQPSAGGEMTTSVATRPVVVAASDLGVGSELKREDLRTVEWPAGALPAGAISNPEEVVGRGVIMPLVEHELVLQAKLAAKEAGAGLPPAIPPGLRAVSVRVNEVIGVAGYVGPGTHVDVIVTVSPSQQQQDTTAKVILTNVMVVAAGTKLETTGAGEKPTPVNVVTLLVNPDEAERLTLASTEGKIQLALRNPLDLETPQTKGVRPAALLGTPPPVRQVASRRSAAAPVLVAQAPKADTVEIIRGDKRSHETVRGEQ